MNEPKYYILIALIMLLSIVGVLLIIMCIGLRNNLRRSQETVSILHLKIKNIDKRNRYDTASSFAGERKRDIIRDIANNFVELMDNNISVEDLIERLLYNVDLSDSDLIYLQQFYNNQVSEIHDSRDRIDMME